MLEPTLALHSWRPLTPSSPYRLPLVPPMYTTPCTTNGAVLSVPSPVKLQASLPVVAS